MYFLKASVTLFLTVATTHHEPYPPVGSGAVLAWTANNLTLTSWAVQVVFRHQSYRCVDISNTKTWYTPAFGILQRVPPRVDTTTKSCTTDLLIVCLGVLDTWYSLATCRSGCGACQ